MRIIAIAFIKAYQTLCRIFMAPCCRFFPSCSDYALEAFRRLGSARGLRLSVRRLLNCHPYNPGGFDPVPRS